MSEEIRSNTENGLSSALESLFSDPQARERFEAIVGALKSAPQPAGEQVAQPESGTNTTPPDGLASILSNPALMENLPTLLAGMRPPNLPEAREKSPEEHRRDLLLALKPFLSKDRGNAVDLILQISRLGTVLHTMQ